MKKLELLSPAKNLEQGKAAINHGADALYIGAPLFGARQAAGNSMADIEELVRYAHLYGSKVFATVNTLLYDNELEEAQRMMWQLYYAGVDAAIVQDMGLLEMNLPPIELHASTQTHNYDLRRVKFLEQVGFKRIILARETSLEQMTALRKETAVDLEAFVHGALCVCFSGQCYMSLYLNGRSGNRGACSQPCRSAYDLANGNGKVLRHNEHLLSLRDFNASQHLESMIAAGITSFKIEGRLKDISYVKNITAYYRQLLDKILAGKQGSALCAASSGTTRFFFTPDPYRTFNRGYTDYFLVDRHPMASPATQKSLGKPIGTAVSCKGNTLIVKAIEPLTPGDGLCFFSKEKVLEGFLVNGTQVSPPAKSHGTQASPPATTIIANKPLSIPPGTTLYRNNDFAFEKQLKGNSAERKIAVSMTVDETPEGLQLTLTDIDGCQATEKLSCEKQPANAPDKMRETIERQLSKLGDTPFEITKFESNISIPFFVPASLLNDLRRKAVAQLQETRILHFSPKATTFVPSDLPYFEETVGPLANIINSKSEAFYRRHHTEVSGLGPDHNPRDLTNNPAFKTPLMTCKYCLRYELGQCLRLKCNTDVGNDWRGDLYLLNNGHRFRLHFDCTNCQMQIFADN